jgi:hypothetical protein
MAHRQPRIYASDALRAAYRARPRELTAVTLAQALGITLPELSRLTTTFLVRSPKNTARLTTLAKLLRVKGDPFQDITQAVIDERAQFARLTVEALVRKNAAGR